MCLRTQTRAHTNPVGRCPTACTCISPRHTEGDRQTARGLWVGVSIPTDTPVHVPTPVYTRRVSPRTSARTPVHLHTPTATHMHTLTYGAEQCLYSDTYHIHVFPYGYVSTCTSIYTSVFLLVSFFIPGYLYGCTSTRIYMLRRRCERKPCVPSLPRSARAPPARCQRGQAATGEIRLPSSWPHRAGDSLT